ncbi:MAG TPA: hypothetical protein VIW69_13715, partial [Candidatus Elarobacter sp.]
MVVDDRPRRPPVATVVALIVVGVALLLGAMYFRKGDSAPKPAPVAAATAASSPHPAPAEKQRVITEFYD